MFNNDIYSFMKRFQQIFVKVSTIVSFRLLSISLLLLPCKKLFGVKSKHLLLMRSLIELEGGCLLFLQFDLKWR